MNKKYNSFKKDLGRARIDLESDTIKIMLVSDSYVPDEDNHSKVSDVYAHEISGTNYEAGGKELLNKTLIQNNEIDKCVFDADNLVWNDATFTARGAVIYKSRGGSPSNDELIMYYDFGENKSVSSGRFRIRFSETGIFSIS